MRTVVAWASLALLPSISTADDLPRAVAEDGPPEAVETAQEGLQDPDLPRPEHLAPAEPRFEPRYSARDRIRVSLLWVQTTMRYDTREYYPGVFSGEVDLGSRADLPRFTLGLAFSLELGPIRADAGYVRTSSRSVLDRALSFEEKTFGAGAEVETLAFAAWLDVAGRIPLAGDARTRGSLSLLLGITAPKVKLVVDDGDDRGREGFSALWPVPCVGLEGGYWLTDRIRLFGSVVGTRLSYTNPFHLDAGEPQKIDYTSLRLEAGLSVDLARGWSLSAGFTRFLLDVESSSEKDDKDRAVFEGRGFFLAVDVRF